jgi:hypothetical protein
VSELDDTDSGNGLGRLRRMFGQDSFLGRLFAVIGLLGGRDSRESTRDGRIGPFVSYDDIENGNTAFQAEASPLDKARRAFEDIKNGTFHYASGKVTNRSAMASLSHNLEDGSEIVREWLARAGADVSALDPTGKKSGADMEAELRDAARLGHIARARRYFAAIVSHGDHLEGVGQELSPLPDDPAEMAKRMKQELDIANRLATTGGGPVDLSALDPTGAKSSAAMEDEVHRRIVEGYVINARKEFFLLRSGEPDFDGDHAAKTQSWLDKANEAAREYGFAPIDASALNPAKSASEAQRDLLRAAENDHVQKASLILYESRHGGFGDPREAADRLNAEMAAANKVAAALGDRPMDASMLDAEGGKYLAASERDLKALATGNYQSGVERLARTMGAAEKAALQDEPALAALIRPLQTPVQFPQQIRRKD